MDEYHDMVAASFRSPVGGLVGCWWLVAPIFAGVILHNHWSDDDVCDAGFREQWRWWLLKTHVILPACSFAVGVVSACMVFIGVSGYIRSAVVV